MQSDPRSEVWTLTSYLQDESAGNPRQMRWCQVFIKAGFKVVAFNIRGAFRTARIVLADAAALEEFREQVKVQARSIPSVREGLINRCARKVKHLLLADLWLPNIWHLLIMVIAGLQKSKVPIVLMASSPPFSLALISAIAKSLYPRRVRLVIDMRDAWALHSGLGGIRSLKIRIERMVLRRADHVLTVSHGLRREFNDVYDVPVRTLYNVATHYFDLPKSESVDWKILNQKILAQSRKFVYTGSISEKFYDVSTFVSGIRRAIRAHGLSADRLQLIFVGACDPLAREVRKQGGCSDVVVFVPHQSHRIAQSIQQQADGLLFFACKGDNNLGVVSTKFFEYLALAKPILPISICRGSDVDELLERFAGGGLCLQSENDVAEALTCTMAGTQQLPICTTPPQLAVLLQDYSEFARRLLIYLRYR